MWLQGLPYVFVVLSALLIRRVQLRSHCRLYPKSNPARWWLRRLARHRCRTARPWRLGWYVSVPSTHHSPSVPGGAAGAAAGAAGGAAGGAAAGAGSDAAKAGEDEEEPEDEDGDDDGDGDSGTGNSGGWGGVLGSLFG